MFTQQMGDAILVFRDVPAEVCKVCGEAHFTTETAGTVYRMATHTGSQLDEVRVLRFKAG